MTIISFNPTDRYALANENTEERYHYIEIDYHDGGDIDVLSMHESGSNSCPAWIWHGHGTHHPIHSDLDADALKEWMVVVLVPLVETICDGYSSRWDGNNTVGVFDEDAMEAKNNVELAIDDINQHTRKIEMMSVSNWIDYSDIQLEANATDAEIEALADEWISILRVDVDGVFVGGRDAVINGIRNVLGEKQ